LFQVSTADQGSEELKQLQSAVNVNPQAERGNLWEVGDWRQAFLAGGINTELLSNSRNRFA
jgi:hypothetical protein